MYTDTHGASIAGFAFARMPGFNVDLETGHALQHAQGGTGGVEDRVRRLRQGGDRHGTAPLNAPQKFHCASGR